MDEPPFQTWPYGFIFMSNLLFAVIVAWKLVHYRNSPQTTRFFRLVHVFLIIGFLLISITAFQALAANHPDDLNPSMMITEAIGLWFISSFFFLAASSICVSMMKKHNYWEWKLGPIPLVVYVGSGIFSMFIAFHQEKVHGIWDSAERLRLLSLVSISIGCCSLFVCTCVMSFCGDHHSAAFIDKFRALLTQCGGACFCLGHVICFMVLPPESRRFSLWFCLRFLCTAFSFGAWHLTFRWFEKLENAVAHSSSDLDEHDSPTPTAVSNKAPESQLVPSFEIGSEDELSGKPSGHDPSEVEFASEEMIPMTVKVQ